MKITFIRHSKVDFKWKARYHSRDFDLACGAYDHAHTLNCGSLKLTGKSVYISELKRAEETAHAFLHGEKELFRTALLNEIPLNSFMETKIKLPTFIWMIAGRLQWYFNSSRQKEVRTQSKLRINHFLNLLEEKNEDCTIIGHGFYFAQMMSEIKKRKASGNTGKRIQNEEVRTFILHPLRDEGTDQFPQ
ncbi:histidine phosphatase [Pedobacter sp. KBW06]|uniref:histidine phosphatase family protein n=1 Tax=Pedobacter sp. KBW06 TaxID=2153359 RepID=UPI000F59D145|nr:histidine phosphatase family protein [Pedobacter sp. KBW06]RQO70047.1 histidine phosphatase [Pedobacter sp. KBW06]